MAKYGINKEGVDALNQLANDLSSINNDIDDDGKKLKSTVAGLGDNLGIYEEQINEIIEKVNSEQQKGTIAFASTVPGSIIPIKMKDHPNGLITY